MKKESFKDQCTDMKQELNLQIPCLLAQRAEAYASAYNTTITSVVIEALDIFLREEKNRNV